MSILQYFWTAISNNWSWKPIFGLYESYCIVNLKQIIKYLKQFIDCLRLSVRYIEITLYLGCQRLFLSHQTLKTLLLYSACHINFFPTCSDELPIVLALISGSKLFDADRFPQRLLLKVFFKSICSWQNMQNYSVTKNKAIAGDIFHQFLTILYP